jgi:hypothetical protein
MDFSTELYSHKFMTNIIGHKLHLEKKFRVS